MQIYKVKLNNVWNQKNHQACKETGKYDRKRRKITT